MINARSLFVCFLMVSCYYSSDEEVNEDGNDFGEISVAIIPSRSMILGDPLMSAGDLGMGMSMMKIMSDMIDSEINEGIEEAEKPQTMSITMTSVGGMDANGKQIEPKTSIKIDGDVDMDLQNLTDPLGIIPQILNDTLQDQVTPETEVDSLVGEVKQIKNQNEKEKLKKEVKETKESQKRVEKKIDEMITQTKISNANYYAIFLCSLTLSMILLFILLTTYYKSYYRKYNKEPFKPLKPFKYFFKKPIDAENQVPAICVRYIEEQ